MADGSTERIDSLQVGDRVRATNPTTGKTADEPVTDVIVGQGLKHLVDVAVTNDGKSDSVTATDNHPFWVTDLGRWVNAGQLKIGEHLLTDDGRAVVVKGLHTHDEVTRVYNLTVDTLHTYYVLVGADQVLVHNSPGDMCGPGGDASSANAERLRQQLSHEAGQLPGVRSREDIFHTPSVLSGGVTPDQVAPFFENAPGWQFEGLGRGRNAGGGWVAREYASNGEPTGRMLRWNPGGGHHGDGAYWRVVGTEGDLGASFDER